MLPIGAIPEWPSNPILICGDRSRSAGRFFDWEQGQQQPRQVMATIDQPIFAGRIRIIGGWHSSITSREEEKSGSIRMTIANVGAIVCHFALAFLGTSTALYWS